MSAREDNGRSDCVDAERGNEKNIEMCDEGEGVRKLWKNSFGASGKCDIMI